MSDAPPRVRFAPAPSGSLHVGGARTALFNWLYARRNGGTFVLRVEDTDADRVTDEAMRVLERSLHWLGLDWDEGPGVGGSRGPYRQTERFDVYRDAAGVLVEGGHAYRCYCTPEELEERRRQAKAADRAPGYDGRCRRLTDEERAAFEAEGRPWALRFAIPEGRSVEFDDLVKGPQHFDYEALRDFVIVRSDGSPTYLLASGVDDLRMGMTHVIRGEDLLPSTPRQLLMFEALGEPAPQYAHLPLILGPDRAKLSKRHGAVAVEWFREHGYLPDALVNYLALLGWSPGNNDEILPRAELVERFDLSAVSRHPAIFDIEKLAWMNGEYLRALSDEEVAAGMLTSLSEAGLVADLDTLRAIAPHVKERMKRLDEAPAMLRFLFSDDVALDEKAEAAVAKVGPDYLRRAADRVASVSPWTVEGITAALDEVAASADLNRSKGWQPVRAAVTGTTVSPPLPESLTLLGRDETVARLRAAAG
ncbi:MAG TPA: glutamate--tRNA ligase [Actinomycetota bacterium]|jgi:glutamyl-tRNA synthetase